MQEAARTIKRTRKRAKRSTSSVVGDFAGAKSKRKLGVKHKCASSRALGNERSLFFILSSFAFLLPFFSQKSNFFLFLLSFVNKSGYCKLYAVKERREDIEDEVVDKTAAEKH